MKRNEAIIIIAKYIYGSGVEPAGCEVVADDILIALEEAGMLPPKAWVVYLGDDPDEKEQTLAEKPKDALEYIDGEWGNEWETED